eukprot:7553850-Prorocentrum_lima.AAC.1
MTSSLVGSEMCIRDSLTFEATLQEFLAAQDSEARQMPVQLFPTAPPSPVSYTHLTLPTICSV